VIVPAPAPLTPAAVVMPIKPDSSPTSDQADDLRSKLADAQSEIDRLRGLLVAPQTTDSATSGFRRRSPQTETGFTEVTETELSPRETSSVTSVENGVPPQIVAIIALLVFTLTYLFF